MRIGLDLGGTKIASVALDDDGRELFGERRSTPRGDYGQTLAALVDMVAAAERETGLTGTVGLGIPGVICPTRGVVKNANSHWLNGRPLDADLADALGRPVRVANDANCFAVSEAVDGAGAGARVVFGVILGTGVGGGLVIDRRPIGGANGIAGEWGLNPLPDPDQTELAYKPVRAAGGQGVIETYCSGPGLAADFKHTTGRELDSRGVVAAAESGDHEAEAALQRYERRLAKSLALVINIVDPEVIVLGGGMGNVARLYQNIPKLWAQTGSVRSEEIATRLAPPRFGDDSGKRGAAWLWLED